MAQQEDKIGNSSAHVEIFSAQVGFILGLIIMFITGHGVFLTVGLVVGLTLGILLNLLALIEKIPNDK